MNISFASTYFLADKQPVCQKVQTKKSSIIVDPEQPHNQENVPYLVKLFPSNIVSLDKQLLLNDYLSGQRRPPHRHHSPDPNTF